VRVVIADDNFLIREGTRRLLEDSGEVEVLMASDKASGMTGTTVNLTMGSLDD
jgi:DNA-binding NarL/FixJ family response regulator